MSVWSRKCKDLALLVQDLRAQNTRIKERSRSKSSPEPVTHSQHLTPDPLVNGEGLHLHVSKSPDTAKTTEGISKTNSSVSPSSPVHNETALADGSLSARIGLPSPPVHLNGVVGKALSLKPRVGSQGPAESNNGGDAARERINGSSDERTRPSVRITPETNDCIKAGARGELGQDVNGCAFESTSAQKEIAWPGTDGGSDMASRSRFLEKDLLRSSSGGNLDATDQTQSRRSRSGFDLQVIPEEPVVTFAPRRRVDLSDNPDRYQADTDFVNSVDGPDSCCHVRGESDASQVGSFPLSSFAHPARIRCAICVKRGSLSESPDPTRLVPTQVDTSRSLSDSAHALPTSRSLPEGNDGQSDLRVNGSTRVEAKQNPSEVPDPTQLSRSDFEIYLQGLVRSTTDERQEATCQDRRLLDASVSSSALSSAPSTPELEADTHTARHLRDVCENNSISPTRSLEENPNVMNLVPGSRQIAGTDTTNTGENCSKRVSFSDTFDGAVTLQGFEVASGRRMGKNTQDFGVSTCVEEGTSRQTGGNLQSPVAVEEPSLLAEAASQTEVDSALPRVPSPNLSIESWCQTDGLLANGDTSSSDGPGKTRSFSTQLSFCSDCSSQTDDAFLQSMSKSGLFALGQREHENRLTSEASFKEKSMCTNYTVHQKSKHSEVIYNPHEICDQSSSSVMGTPPKDQSASEVDTVCSNSPRMPVSVHVTGISTQSDCVEPLAQSQNQDVSSTVCVSGTARTVSLAAPLKPTDQVSVQLSWPETQSRNEPPVATECLSFSSKTLPQVDLPQRQSGVPENPESQQPVQLQATPAVSQVSSPQSLPLTRRPHDVLEPEPGNQPGRMPNGEPVNLQAPSKYPLPARVNEDCVQAGISGRLSENVYLQRTSAVPQHYQGLPQSVDPHGQPNFLQPPHLGHGHLSVPYYGQYPPSPPGVFHPSSPWSSGYPAGVSHPLTFIPSVNGLSPPWHPSFYPPGAWTLPPNPLSQGTSGSASADHSNAANQSHPAGSSEGQSGLLRDSPHKSRSPETVPSQGQRLVASSENSRPVAHRVMESSTLSSDSSNSGSSHAANCDHVSTFARNEKTAFAIESRDTAHLQVSPSPSVYSCPKESIFSSPITLPTVSPPVVTSTVLENFPLKPQHAKSIESQRAAHPFSTSSWSYGVLQSSTSSSQSSMHSAGLDTVAKTSEVSRTTSLALDLKQSAITTRDSSIFLSHIVYSDPLKQTPTYSQTVSSPIPSIRMPDAWPTLQRSSDERLGIGEIPQSSSTTSNAAGANEYSGTGELCRNRLSDESTAPLASEAVSSIISDVRHDLGYDASDSSSSAVNSFLSTLVEESEEVQSNGYDRRSATSEMEVPGRELLGSLSSQPGHSRTLNHSSEKGDTGRVLPLGAARSSPNSETSENPVLSSPDSETTRQEGHSPYVLSSGNHEASNWEGISPCPKHRVSVKEESSCAKGREESGSECDGLNKVPVSGRVGRQDAEADGGFDDFRLGSGMKRSDYEESVGTEASELSGRNSVRDTDDDCDRLQDDRYPLPNKERGCKERERSSASRQCGRDAKTDSSSAESSKSTRWVFRVPGQSKSSKVKAKNSTAPLSKTRDSGRKARRPATADKSPQLCGSLSSRPHGAAESKMEAPEDTCLMLDEEFDKLLADMKPHVLKLPHKSERQRCAVWIKKLCETQPRGVTCRKTRNLYSHLMLHMLRRGKLDAPFDKKPPEGTLPPLPSYMSMYFDIGTSFVGGRIVQGEYIPDWVAGELTSSFGSSLFGKSDLGNPAATSTWMSSGSLRARPHSSLGLSLERERSLSPSRRDYLGMNDRGLGFSLDDMSMDLKRPSPVRVTLSDSEQFGGVERGRRRRQSSPSRRGKLESSEDWRKPYDLTATLGTTQSFDKSRTAVNFANELPLPKTSDRELQMRLKMMETKFHEDKLHLQQKHDAAVQKILDRKNAEIEDVKGHYRTKAKDLEETISKLERKIQTLVRESAVVRETKDKQLIELRKMLDDTSTTSKSEMEKRLHEAMADFEQEKYDLQKQHTKNIQDILDETNVRLQRMEQEYSQQASATAQVISDLESRVQQLTRETNSTLQQRSQLETEKAELHSTIDRLKGELDDVSDRYRQLEREHQNTLEAQEQEMRGLKNKTEASLEYLKQEHSLATSKASDTIIELERELDRLKRNMKESEEQRQRQLRDIEQANHQDKIHLENLHDKQIRNVKKEMDQLEQEFQKKIKRMEFLVAEKEQENSLLREANRDSSSQAERALEEFRQQVERNQSRVYEEMKQQMDQVEQDLKKSKQARERQAHEFSRQLEEEKFQHEKELTEMKMSFEGEKAAMVRELHQQKEYILAEHEKDLEKLKFAHRAEIQDLESRLRDRQDRSQKTIKELENQLRDLREELVQANQLRKQQLVELGLLREEEKQKMQRDHEAEITRLRTEFEQGKLELQKSHSAEMEALLEKTNNRLKGIEKEYAERGQKSSETMTELQATVNHLRGEIKRVKANAEKKAAEQAAQHEEELKNLRLQNATSSNSLQQELETQREKVRSLERKMQKVEADAEEKNNQLKQTYENKMKGLMPAEVRQELEETIESLKSQVVSLQQRAEVLQDELDTKSKAPLAGFVSKNQLKRRRRQQIRRLQEAIVTDNRETFEELLRGIEDVDFQYRSQTPLQCAVKAGNAWYCEALLQQGACINVCDAEENSVLDAACWRDFEEVVKVLIKYKADVNCRNFKGFTPLNSCALRGHASIVKLLLAAGADCNIANEKRETPLFLAAQRDHVDIVKCLLEVPDCDVNKATVYQRTPLMAACEKRHRDVARILLTLGSSRAGEKININSCNGAESALFCAVQSGAYEIVQELIQHGADMNAKVKGLSSLACAIRGNEFDIAKLLIASGCEVNITDSEGQTPLFLAIHRERYFADQEFDFLDLVQDLLQANADVNLTNKSGLSPLHVAATYKHPALMETLLQRGANVLAVTDSGETVLHEAIHSGNTDTIRLLLEKGCPPNKQNDRGYHALMLAVIEKSPEQVLQTLVKGGSDLNLKDYMDGNTPLHLAILWRSTEIATFLINSGCDIAAENKEFETPLYLACSRREEEIIDLLLKEFHPRVPNCNPSALPLHVAAKQSFPNLIRKLVDAGFNIDEVASSGLTPLQTALTENNISACAALLERGASVVAHRARPRILTTCCLNTSDPHPHFHLEPLFLAMQHKNVAMMGILLQCSPSIPQDILRTLRDIVKSPEVRQRFPPAILQAIADLIRKALFEPRSLLEECRGPVRQKVGSPLHANLCKLFGGDTNIIPNYVCMTHALQELEDEHEATKVSFHTMRYAV